MPPFAVIGDFLRMKFEIARRVVNKNHGYGLLVSERKTREKRSPRDSELIYYEKSPNFCTADPEIGWAGTTGRACEVTGDPRREDSCHVLCCGRGFNTIYVRKMVDCDCQFIWCCEVICQSCEANVPMHFCK